MSAQQHPRYTALRDMGAAPTRVSRAKVDTDHPFIASLDTLFKEEKSTWKFIDLWRRKIAHNALERARLSEYIEVNDNCHPPEHIAFAMRITGTIGVKLIFVEKILKGLIVPSEAQLHQIATNFGMEPEADKTKEFIAQGIDYANTRTNVLPMSETPTEITTRATASKHLRSSRPAVCRAMIDLRESRLLHQTVGFPIVRDSVEARKKKHRTVSIDTLEERSGLSHGTVSLFERGLIPIDQHVWDHVIFHLLNTLKATPEERATVEAAFNESKVRNFSCR